MFYKADLDPPVGRLTASLMTEVGAAYAEHSLCNRTSATWP